MRHVRERRGTLPQLPHAHLMKLVQRIRAAVNRQVIHLSHRAESTHPTHLQSDRAGITQGLRKLYRPQPGLDLLTELPHIHGHVCAEPHGDVLPQQAGCQGVGHMRNKAQVALPLFQRR